MQFVNDDMDELFRKAAENYPLKTDNADWNKVLQGLQKDDSSDEPGDNKTNYRKYLWLLLLLPLAFICNRYVGNNKSVNKETVNKTAATQQATAENKNNNNQADKVTGTKEEKENVVPPATTSIVGETVITQDSKTTGDKTAATKADAKWNSGKDKKSVSGDDGVNNTTANNSDDKTVTQGKNNIGTDLNAIGKSSGNNTDVTKDNAANTKQDNANNTAVAPAPVVTAPGNKKDSAVTAKTEKNKKEKLKLKKGFYLSLLGGPDISTVKMQQVQKVGYSIGLMGGYRITGNFGVELGVLWDKKQYYTDGDKFSTGKITLPPNVSIKDVAGNCTMIEIPVSVRYDFAIKKNSNFFTTLGMSSYLMAKEKYDYMWDRNGNVYGGHREYNSTSKSWFSVIHASVGYEKKIGAIGNLRLEPYLKIPLTGVGIGSLPITSVGMYIGVTKHF